MRPIAEFFDRDLITDVVGQLKAGKEAKVFVCRAHPETGFDLLAAKVYRQRDERGFRSEAPYLEGRSSLRRGRARERSVTRAIDRRSRAGKALLSATWVRREYEVLRRLQAEGVRVPAPVACTEQAVLMQYLGDEESPAPRLLTQTLSDGEALRFRADLLDAVERFLRLGIC
jgi:RIO kinase 1